MSKPIRVAQIIGEAPNGGVESVIMNYYRFLDKNKFQFDFFVNNESDIIQKSQIESMGGRVVIIPPYKKNLVKFERFLKDKFSENKYLVVHSNMNTLSYFVLRAAKNAGVPIRIAHSHSTSNKKELFRNLAKNVLKVLSRKNANAFLACSELAGKWLFGRKFFEAGQVRVINNGIDLDRFQFSEENRKGVREEYLIGENSFVVGTVGRFVKQKNQKFMIDVFFEIYKENPDSYLLLVGDGPLKKQLHEQVCSLGLDEHVIFAGVHKHPEKYYSAMDVFLLTSLYEGLPVVGVEAQTNGLSCYFSDNITSESKIFDCQYYSLSLSAKDWARKILLNHAIIDRKQNYLALFNSRYDIKKQAKKLESFYLSELEKYNK